MATATYELEYTLDEGLNGIWHLLKFLKFIRHLNAKVTNFRIWVLQVSIIIIIIISSKCLQMVLLCF